MKKQNSYIGKNEKGLISLPNGLWIDLWQDFIAHDHENLKIKLLYKF